MKKPDKKSRVDDLISEAEGKEMKEEIKAQPEKKPEKKEVPNKEETQPQDKEKLSREENDLLRAINAEKENQKLVEIIKKLELENKNIILEFESLVKEMQERAKKQIAEKVEEANKKLESEKESMKKYGSQKLIESIIEPVINIELAVKAGKDQEAVSAYVIGFEMLLNQLHNEMESFGIKRIVPNEGEEFDPMDHYAITVSGDTNKITKLVKPGFKLHDRVIKPATVEVG